MNDVAFTSPATVNLCEGVVVNIPTRFVPVSILIAGFCTCDWFYINI